jgi:hypothetical protein
MKPHGGLCTGFQPFRHFVEPRTDIGPVIERRLQRAGDMADLGTAGQIAGDDDQTAIAGGVLECGELHDFGFRFY